MSINSLIESVSHDILNPFHNFEIAKEYERLNQTASAVSFYLRAAEYGVDNPAARDVVYASLLRMSICFEDQKDRSWTVSNCLLQALEFAPERPEAYFLYARFHERSQNWQECYTFASMGLQLALQVEPLPVDVEYPGIYGLEFEKAVSAWWIGRKDESQEIFERLLADSSVSDTYVGAIKYNMERL